MRIVRLILLALVCFVAGLTLGVYLGWRYFAPPETFRPRVFTPEEKAAMNDSLQTRLTGIGRNLVTSRPTTSIAPSTTQTRPTSQGTQANSQNTPEADNRLVIAEDDINLQLGKFLEKNRSKTDDLMKNPCLAIERDALVFGALLPDFGMVVSFHCDARLNAKGDLVLSLNKITSGREALPEEMVNRAVARVNFQARQKLARWQKDAEIAADGSANTSAISAAMGKLILRAMEATPKPVPAVIFIPVDDSKVVPARITRMSLRHQEADFSLAPMEAGERKAFLDWLKTPE